MTELPGARVYALATIPALQSAATDRRLSSHEKAVILWCYHTPLLSVVEFRPLKVSQVQVETRIRERTVANAINRLRNLGYLHCSWQNPRAPEPLRTESRPRWYRLAYQLEVAKAA